MKSKLGRTLILTLIVIGVAGYCAVMFLQSRKPPLPALPAENGAVTGHGTVSMVVELMEAQLNGFGGWLPNDLPGSPGYFLDNLPNFQLGVLSTVRHTSRVLRDNLTRQRTSDQLHKETDIAYSAYANDPAKWAFPSAEGIFGRGNAALLRFRDDLGGQANFFPRADNLIQLLEQMISELGAVSALLLDARDGDKVGWFEVDDNFYYAQGVAYAMYGVVGAVRADFRQVIKDKNALEITDLIVHSLRESQFEPWIIGNGSKDGIMANHSNNLKVYLDDARQKMKSLVSILDQG